MAAAMTLTDVEAKCNEAIASMTSGGVARNPRPGERDPIKMTPRRLRMALNHVVTDAELYRGLVRADALILREAIARLVEEIENRFSPFNA